MADIQTTHLHLHSYLLSPTTFAVPVVATSAAESFGADTFLPVPSFDLQILKNSSSREVTASGPGGSFRFPFFGKGAFFFT